MIGYSRVARRYATALFHAAEKAGVLDNVKADLALIDGFLRDHPEVGLALKAPRIPADRKKAVFHSLLAEQIREPLTLRFVNLLVDKNREAAIPDVVLAFTKLDEESRGVVSAKVSTALPMDEDQAGRMKQSLDALTGKDVRLEFTVDPNLIGGVTVHIGDTVLDGSVKGYLEQFGRQIRAVPAGALTSTASA
ncbi:MAG: ATP synthase F1 subunit delta [Armatimonadetes bacterium]|nr:ATP synthase F1 subunit delta [Armatimonadota bacterium]